MSGPSKKALASTRTENYPAWYQSVIAVSELAENSLTRGSMVIRPYGFALWEEIQQPLDKKFKEMGHQNAYFPLLIPLSLLQKEAEHVDGFAKECAVVTHHRLESDSQGQLKPAGELEEPYVIRPTSEMMIGECFSRWIQSYRDLPLKLNQWANVMRWEMRTRLFLRTSEFLWQEGHTAHADQDSAHQHTLDMLHVYEDFCHQYLALPVLKGQKPEHEKFPGAQATYCIESLMQDNKALQAGTSHFMGQNFARSCGIEFSNQQGQREHCWTTSWGVTTRLIGALIMTHSDDNGLVLPPKVAPYQVVLCPLIKKNACGEKIISTCEQLAQTLRGQGLRVHLDHHQHSSWHWIKKGVPVRVEIGMKELEAEKVSFFTRAFDLHKKRQEMSFSDFSNQIQDILDQLQTDLFKAAQLRQEQQTHRAHTLEELKAYFAKEQSPGFVIAPLHYNKVVEELLEEMRVSVRYLPLKSDPLSSSQEQTCLVTGEPNAQVMVLARAY